MKYKHLFALAPPLVFLVACLDVTEVKFVIPCEIPIPVVTDTLLTGTFNGACPYYIMDNDTLILVTPGTV
ncbi:hypothetical protein LCGC14_2735420 [marine sediment metagenome]|uniref:Lipoprotein n=1 Tax=marine sediment metagenome TaxID=412755 RepID=A0A0F8Z627_9ZZZZ